MKIVVTGATGFVGRSLVPMLAAAGADLLLVGRRPERMTRLFPGISACTYDALLQEAAGFDLLVHLAVANNDAKLPEETFRDVNVRLLVETAEKARQAGISRFLNISSTHALDSRNRSPYAQTKREAVRLLAEVKGLTAVTVFLPAVYGDTWSGKLSVLNRLPRPVAGLLFPAYAALKPTVHVSRLAAFIMENMEHENEPEIILSDGQEGNLVYHFFKRAIDLTFALSVGILFCWGLLLIWALIRLQSPGPGIFAQRRIGQDGAVFTCYKFRTMKQDTEEVGTHQVSAQAVTGFGRFLRATKLDELPQIWNILRNEISLVGPRPCLPTQTKLIDARRRRGVLRLKPGISGLAQIKGLDMSKPDRLAQWDAHYLALQSLLLDLKIIVLTALGRGRGDRVVTDMRER